MLKNYTSLGLMSGTSGDGVDASLINSDGVNYYESIKDKHFEYDDEIFKGIHKIKEKINNKLDLKNFSEEINNLSRKITIFHAKVIKDLSIEINDYLIGFHGQTIYHNPKEKISFQLGDAKLLNQLTKKIIYNFRENDIKSGGDGAPLVPLFHQLIATQEKIVLPVCILNIGGISNITIVNQQTGSEDLLSKDIGPGNCLIDKWIRNNSNKKYDSNGDLAHRGIKNEIILEQAQELYANRLNKQKRSFDVNDFDISFARGLSLVDGVRTLTDFTANIIGEELELCISKNNDQIKSIITCGGGRKNKFLMNKIQEFLGSSIRLKLIDDFNIDGDFVESKAFAFLAIRSYEKMPISFPKTTGCLKSCTGGEVIEN